MSTGAIFKADTPLTREEEFRARVLAVHELHGMGWSLRRIGRSLDISHEWVRKLLALTVETPVN